MRTYLAIAAGAALLAGTLTTGGCVSKQQYDEVMQANRRLKGSLNTSLATQRELQAKNDALTGDLEAKDGLLARGESKFQVLQLSHTELRGDFAKLQEAYEALKKGRDRPITFTNLPPLVDKALTEFARQHPEMVEYLPKYGMVKFKADLTFDLGKDIVKDQAVAALGAFANVVNGPAAEKFHIYIAGHTDDVPIGKPETRRRHPNNWYLSVHRAVAVQEALANARIAPSRLGAMGFGEYHPIAPNQPNKKGNPANRRVELWIIPPGRFMTAGGAAVAPAPVGGAVIK